MSTDKKLELQGIVQRHPIPELLVEINQIGLSGSLRVSDRERKTVIYFESGEVAFAVSNSREHRLFSILLQQERIEEKDLAGLDDFVNDFRLSHLLQKENILTPEEASEYLKFQVSAVIGSAAGLKQGNWVFSPLSRLKKDLKADVDLRSLLFRHSKDLTDFEVLSRFKSLEEQFSLNPNAKESAIAFSPEEAFVLSRIGDTGFTIEQLMDVSGLSGDELMPVLYRLWLGGFIVRDNWNKAFSRETVDKFRNAKVTLSKTALSVEEEERKKEEEAKREAKEKAEAERQASERKRLAEERRSREKRELDEAFTEKDLSLEEYLDLVANAPTYYQMFGIDPDANLMTVKRAYFSYARRFHPDVLVKTVEPQRHKMIQMAFTEIAQAYETLRNEDSRKIYDLKLEKVIEALKRNTGADLSSLSREEVEDQDRTAAAKESFDRGKRFLDDGFHEDAIPHLGRAVHMDNENPEYHAVYGVALSKEKKNRHKAEQELKEAVRLSSGESRFRLMLVELYVEIGLSVRARNELNSILEEDPGNGRAKELLSSLS